MAIELYAGGAGHCSGLAQRQQTPGLVEPDDHDIGCAGRTGPVDVVVGEDRLVERDRDRDVAAQLRRPIEVVEDERLLDPVDVVSP